MQSKKEELGGDSKEKGELQKTYSVNEEEDSFLSSKESESGGFEAMTSATRQMLFAASNGDVAELARLTKKGSDPRQGDYDDR